MLKNNFAKNLIKGRIAETIFEQMLCEAGDFTIIPFGYEKLVPELARHRKFPRAQKVIDNIRSAPDYAVIFPDKKSIFLIEVKFRAKIDINEIIDLASTQLERWNPSWLFIATLDKGFYLSECSNIVKYKNIQQLDLSIVNEELQNKYNKLIQEFEH